MNCNIRKPSKINVITISIKFLIMLHNVGRDGSVGIATRYGLDGPGIDSRWGARFSTPVQTGRGAHPASYTMDTGSLSWG